MHTKALALGLLATFLLTGCVVHRHRHAGPPPHAPAHGHRHRQHADCELVYDAHLGVYLVVGHPGWYYYSGRFYRNVETHWEVSSTFRGDWTIAAGAEVPPGLKKRGPGPDHPAEGRGRGRGKHKHHTHVSP